MTIVRSLLSSATASAARPSCPPPPRRSQSQSQSPKDIPDRLSVQGLKGIGSGSLSANSINADRHLCLIGWLSRKAILGRLQPLATGRYRPDPDTELTATRNGNNLPNMLEQLQQADGRLVSLYSRQHHQDCAYGTSYPVSGYFFREQTKPLPAYADRGFGI